MIETAPSEQIAQRSTWYGERARHNRLCYVILKSTQIIFAAAIPVVAVAGASNWQRWSTALLGALVGVFEGLIQLGQYQQNWTMFRATREALKREEFLHCGKAGPYSGAQDPDTLLVERCDAIISGENTKWLSSQQQAASKS